MHKIIMSVDKGKDDYTDRHNADAFIDALVGAGVRFHLGIGFYEGKLETAFLIDAPVDHPVVQHFANLTNQDCAVLVDRLGNAWFYYFYSGVEEYAGEWEEIPAEESSNHAGWTVDLETKATYTIKKN